MIEQLAADNEAGNAGVISNPIMNAATAQFGQSSSSTMAQSQLTTNAASEISISQSQSLDASGNPIPGTAGGAAASGSAGGAAKVQQ